MNYPTEILASKDVTKYFSYCCGKVVVLIKDHTSFNKNSKEMLSRLFYIVNPYWVQIRDEDDFILQKEFYNLNDAINFYADFIKDPLGRIKDMK
jgi:hypothetical protein